jgi:hypothetical protein
MRPASKARRAIRLLLFATLVSPPAAQAAGWTQTDADAYTRYELLEPAKQSFRIVYDVTATTPGAMLYFNPIRVGSEPTVHGVTDLASGKALEWRIVSSEEAAAEGLLNAGHDGEFIRVALARPVPEGGEGRIRIDKTYRDPESVFEGEGRLIFERTLGIRRNAVVLPAGYGLVACNFPSQVATEADGRLRVSFMNRGPEGVPYRVEARHLPASQADGAAPGRLPAGQIVPRQPVVRSEPAGARTDYEPSERAFQDREIVYFLLAPESHSFRLYHDYTESRVGVDRYVNVVRPGSRASDPSAKILDTGEVLTVETLRGDEIAARAVDIGEEPGPDSEAVVIWFDAVRPGESKRLRIEETYTDPGRYGLNGEELLWDRSFGRNRNAVVLPRGWHLTTSAIPAVVSETADGEIRLDFENDRPGDIDVLIRAQRALDVPARGIAGMEPSND